MKSACRAGYSTETVLRKGQNDILLNMDRTQVTLLVLLDLSVAFGAVDHQVLESSFGIILLRYVGFYLICRKDLNASATGAVTPGV